MTRELLEERELEHEADLLALERLLHQAMEIDFALGAIGYWDLAGLKLREIADRTRQAVRRCDEMSRWYREHKG